MSDAITPFFDANDQVEHYSSLPFASYETSTGTGIDEAKLQKAIPRYQAYIKLLSEQGYNAISLDDLNHLLNMEVLFQSRSLLARRNSSLITYFQARVKEARELGLEVYITTDMQFYNDEMTWYLGDLTLENPKLQAFNSRALAQLFVDFPEISGVIMRVGEGGGAYDAGSYKSKILYQTPPSVNTMLKQLLPVFSESGKKLVFRTWSIGVGQVGDLVWNRATYDQVFAGLNSEYFIVSVKHTPGDFFDFSKLNPTLGRGHLQQIVEIQIRREYEGGGDFVNFFPLDYLTLYEHIRKLPTVVGVWNWNQTGGWGRGHHVAFNYGFSFWDEVNFHAIGYILRGGKDLKSFLNDSLANEGFSQAQREVLTRIFFASREVIAQGWYLNDFRKESLTLGKVQVPPLLRIWWDRPTDSLGVWALMLSRLQDTSQTLRDSSETLNVLNGFISDWKAVSSPSKQDQRIGASLVYQRDLFEILSLFRASMIAYFDTGHKEDLDTLNHKIQVFEKKYQGISNFSFDFREIKHFTHKTFSWFSWVVIVFHLCIVMIAVVWYGGGALKAGHYQDKILNKVHTKKLGKGFFSMWKYAPYFFLGSHRRKTTLALVILYGTTLFEIASLSLWYQMYLSSVWFFLGHLLFFLFLILFILKYILAEKHHSITQIFPYENLLLILLALEIPLWASILIPAPWMWLLFASVLFSPLKYVIVFGVLVLFLTGFWRIFSHVFLFEQHKLQKMMLVFCLWIAYLSGVLPLQASKQYWLETISPILPSYFLEAGTDVGEYYE